MANALGTDLLRWVIGTSFIAMAAWKLVPDQVDDAAAGGQHGLSVLGRTVVAFFLAEMGDKMAAKVSMRLVRGIAATVFAVLGFVTLLDIGSLF